MKKIYDYEDLQIAITMAEELDLPYKVIKTKEQHLNEATDQITVIPVWLFKFL